MLQPIMEAAAGSDDGAKSSVPRHNLAVAQMKEQKVRGLLLLLKVRCKVSTLDHDCTTRNDCSSSKPTADADLLTLCMVCPGLRDVAD